MSGPKIKFNKRAQTELRSEIARTQPILGIQRISLYLEIGYKPVYEQPEVRVLDEGEYTLVPVERDGDMVLERNYTRPPIYDLLPYVRLVGWERMDKEDYARYTLQLKTLSKQLDKVLPDLRSVEVFDEVQERRRLSDLELAQRVAGVLPDPSIVAVPPVRRKLDG